MGTTNTTKASPKANAAKASSQKQVTAEEASTGSTQQKADENNLGACARTTKDAILDISLSMFAKQGFEATSVREIAAEVGVKAPSLYKHFPSKQAIFDALVERELTLHEKAAESLGAPATNTKAANAYSRASTVFMGDLAVGLLDHWCSGNAALFRRMLSVERFRSPEMAKVYQELFFDSQLDYETELFANMIELGSFAPSDPASMALQFWAPIVALMELSDCGVPQDELETRIRAHVALFAKLHVSKERNDD